MNRNLWLLALCQGLFLTNNVAFIAINGLVGLALAPVGWMATLPVMAYVVGGALSTQAVASTQSRFGRRVSFQLGLAVALASCLVCALAASSRSFWLLCASTLVAGYYSANALLYRFAAAELVDLPAREKAVSLVMAGGLIGAVVGPNLASGTRDLLAGAPYAGVYVSLAVVALIGMLLMQAIQFPPAPPKAAGATAGRPLGEIMRQPVFIVAAGAGALSYGVMNLLMAATPIAMQQCGLPFSAAALVLEWHVIGMFAPGFFTGHLIRRFGFERIMWCGVLLYVLSIAAALAGVELDKFLTSMLLLGLGWNFIFTGATTLALKAYRPEERDRAQAAINFFQFMTLALTSFSSGLLVTTQGWTLLNWGSFVPTAIIAVALLWLRRVNVQAASAAAA